MPHSHNAWKWILFGSIKNNAVFFGPSSALSIRHPCDDSKQSFASLIQFTPSCVKTLALMGKAFAQANLNMLK